MINNKSGYTLAEVILGTVLAGIVMLGLAVVYLLGVDAWEKTSGRILLQRTASSAIYSLTRAIQRADSLEILDGGNVLACRIPHFENDSTFESITYRLNNFQLYKEANEEKSFLIPFSEKDSIALEPVEGEPLFRYSDGVPTTESERIVEIQFLITRTKNDIKEMIPFSTTVGARNL